MSATVVVLLLFSAGVAAMFGLSWASRRPNQHELPSGIRQTDFGKWAYDAPDGATSYHDSFNLAVEARAEWMRRNNKS